MGGGEPEDLALTNIVHKVKTRESNFVE